VGAVAQRLAAWWFEPIARGRIAALRTLFYAFIFVDVFLTTSWVARHAYVSTDLYQPLFLGRLLELPEPTEALVRVVQVLLLLAAATALTGRFPRLAGTAVFVLYLEWMFIAMSYGKVDHDRVAFLVALAVLPTAGAARWGEREPSEAAGWAVRSIQVAVVATYFLAAFAKFRFGGPGWVNGATLMRAVLRRGTVLAEPLKDNPWILRITQYFIIAFELASPLLLKRGRIGRAFLLLAFSFHLVTYASITIIFLPHVMCLLAFLPLERLDPAAWLSSRREASVPATT
jgi:hypothetical protein